VLCTYQLRLYWEISATTTRTTRKSCAHQRVSEGVKEQGYQKILSIALAIVEEDGKSGGYFVLCTYQLGLYWELTATSTRNARKSCAHHRVAERVGEQAYQKNSVDCSSDSAGGWEIWWVFRALHLSARPLLGAYGHHHQNCQKIVRASESSRKSRTRLSKNSVDCISDGGVVREIWWVFRACGRLSAMPVLGTFGHHHQNCQKNVRVLMSSGKSRRARLSKPLPIAVAIVEQYGKSGCYFVQCGYQLGLYWEPSATTTRTASRTWARQRAAERVGEQGYQKILSIAVAMVA